ncbi:MAG: GerMN domain-containing protein [Bacilli bacterium]|nr:GerMN domain-containing protein [Bacilli bacterium]
MLKRKALRKIIISLSCLFILGILYLFPDKKVELNSNIIHTSETNIVYLMDQNNYISRVSTVLTSEDLKDKIKEIISILTIDSNKYIREGFNKVIPKNTKLLSLTIEDKLVKLNFSKEILNVSIDNEEKMIEAIVYSITSLDNIDYVSIFVEGNILNKLPNSNRRLNTILDRTIGINKEFNINTIDNTTKTTVYYNAKYKDYYYYVPVTKITNDEISKIEIIIKELSSSKMLSTNLISYLNSNTELLSYNETDKTLLLNFNEGILNDITTNNILEEVTYSINLSISDNYDVNEVLYYVNDNIVSTFSIK